MRTRRRSLRYKRIATRFLKIGLPLLGALLLIDLIAAHFSGRIEAALTLPTMHGPPTSVAMGHAPTATPSILSPFESVLVQDSFQRPNQTFWGSASDGQAWVGDAMGSAHFFIVNNMGQVT